MMDWFNQSIKKSKVKLNPFGFKGIDWFDLQGLIEEIDLIIIKDW